MFRIMLLASLLLAGCATTQLQDTYKATQVAPPTLEANIAACVIGDAASAKVTREFYEALGLSVSQETMTGREAYPTLRISDGATTIYMDFNPKNPHYEMDKYDNWPPPQPRQQEREIHACWSVQVGKAVFAKLKESGKHREQKPIGGNPTLLAFDPMGFQVLITQRQEP